MRKFSFLLAVVAVFAMSASAFAGDVSIKDTDFSAVGPINNGTVTTSTSAATNYYFLNNAPHTDIIIGFNAQAASTFTDGAWTAKVSSDVALANMLSTKPSKDSATDVKFTVRSVDLTYSKPSTLIVTATENTTIDTATLTLTPKSVDVSLSADIKGFSDAIALWNGDKNTCTISIDIAGATFNDGGLKIAILSSDMKTASGDTKAKDDKLEAYGGATFTLKETTGASKEKYINVAPTAAAGYATTGPVSYKIGVFAAEDDIEVADPVASKTAIAGFSKDNAIAILSVTVDKTAIDKVIDEIAAKPAVSADVVAALTAGAKAIVLTASGDQAIVNGKVAVAKPLSDDMDSIQMRVAFLKLDGGKIVEGTDPGSVRVVINDSTETNAVSFDVNGGTSPKDITTTQGVANVQITKKDAANGDYTAYVTETPAAGTSEARGAKPADAVTYASQKFKVLATEPYSKSSSGACDMGFGLVAVAGLAALALRKRSK